MKTILLTLIVAFNLEAKILDRGLCEEIANGDQAAYDICMEQEINDYTEENDRIIVDSSIDYASIDNTRKIKPWKK